tara:strand:+ start:980 stop:1576 length:597 start_codon:yes stop_codon:yes gene_type:complete
MSGAAALSAAKRRRGSSVQQPGPPGGNRGRGPVPRPAPRPAPRPQNGMARPPAPTPMMLLQNHHERLASIETEYAKTVEDLNSLKANSDNNKPTFGGDDTIMKLQAKVEFLEEQLNKPEKEESTEDINYFKNKVNEMELQMAELKQHLLKIQNFAMETNLSLMKAKQTEQTVEDTEEEEDMSQPKFGEEDETEELHED